MTSSSPVRVVVRGRPHRGRTIESISIHVVEPWYDDGFEFAESRDEDSYPGLQGLEAMVDHRGDDAVGGEERVSAWTRIRSTVATKIRQAVNIVTTTVRHAVEVSAARVLGRQPLSPSDYWIREIEQSLGIELPAELQLAAQVRHAFTELEATAVERAGGPLEDSARAALLLQVATRVRPRLVRDLVEDVFAAGPAAASTWLEAELFWPEIDWLSQTASNVRTKKET
jgi:hypothetical protein